MVSAVKERPVVPPTEVSPMAKRRTFTAEYKSRMLKQADACTQPGEIGALLRREGLFSSHLVNWRAAREQGALDALARKRGPKARSAEELSWSDRIAALEREIERLRARAERAEALVAFQKKVAAAHLNRLQRDDKEALMQAIQQHSELLGVAAACDALAVPRSSYYRWLRPTASTPPTPRTHPHAANAPARAERD